MSSTTQMIRRRRSRKARLKTERTRARLWIAGLSLLAAAALLIPLGVFVGGALWTYTQATADMPTPGAALLPGGADAPTRFLDSSGQALLYSVGGPLSSVGGPPGSVGGRAWVDAAELPPYVVDALLTEEDPDFRSAARPGLADALLALWENTLFGPLRPDPSLTARLVRSVMLPDDSAADPLDLRTREIALVAEVSRRYSRDEIITWHLNTNDYGSDAYGIEAAAQRYFGKSARDLSLDEAAMLAAIATAPEFNPFDNETAARSRQADTLRRMLVAGLITPTQHEEAARRITTIQPGLGQLPAQAPAFSLYARRQAEAILDAQGLDGDRLVARGGLTITTTLDLDLYQQAECALRAQLGLLSGTGAAVTTTQSGGACVPADDLPAFAPTQPLSSPPDQGQIVVIDAQTGALLAMVGAADRPHAQPGMTLAPFIYFEGFREERQGQRYTPASMLLDIPQRFPGAVEGLIYQPANPDGSFRGPISLTEAASGGRVPPAVQVADNHGLSSIIRIGHRMGLNSLDELAFDLALVDRGGQVAALDLAYAYSVLAAMGDMYGVPTAPIGIGFRTRDPAAVLRIEDAAGQVLWQYDAAASRVNVFSTFSELGYLVNQVFSDEAARAAQFGPDSVLETGRPAAVVTALTNATGAGADGAWTLGYTPQRVVAVHLDRADGAPLALRGYGLEGAAPLFNVLTRYVHARDALPAVDWPRPEAIVEREVCQISGLLPNGICPTRPALFIAAFAPTQVDPYWQQVEVNSQTRQRATANTPAALRLQETYFIPPDDAADWWATNNLPLPPQDYDVLSRPNDDPFRTAVLTNPEPLQWLRGTVSIRGTVSAADFVSYRLRYGEGAVNPQAWVNITEAVTTAPAPDSVLAQWDTGPLEGVYTLELTVEAADGSRERDVVQVLIDNVPPTVILSAGEPGKVYRWPAEQRIPLSAEVSDNRALSRVEFYAEAGGASGGRLLFTDRDAPYSYDLAITGTGTQTFRAVAYDEAGNQNSSAVLSVEVTR